MRHEADPRPNGEGTSGRRVSSWAADDMALVTLLDEGLDDWVPLDAVMWEVAQGDLSPESRAAVLRMLDRLSSEGLMVPGDLGETGFEDWSGSPADWLGRSLAELGRLGWRPMGAGFWLRLTERGEAAARRGR